jgi:hypothetical protein
MLIIESKESLNALLFSLLELKFEMPPVEVSMIASSPYVAEILNNTWDALVQVDKEAGDYGLAYQLEEDRKLESKPALLQVIRDHIRINKGPWNERGPAQKREWVQILISPYLADDELIESIVKEGDAVNSEVV